MEKVVVIGSVAVDPAVGKTVDSAVLQIDTSLVAVVGDGIGINTKTCPVKYVQLLARANYTEVRVGIVDVAVVVVGV